MEGFLPFFIILSASVIFGSLFEKIHLPWVVALIFAGILIGPFGFNVLQVNDTINFLGQAGLIFVMFMAGLDTKLENIKKFQKAILPLSFINGFIPFAVGLIIAFSFQYSLTVALLTGIIFISSSIAIVVPSLQSSGILKSKLGQAVLASSIIQDVASLILLSMFLQNENSLANLPLWLFYPVLIVSLVGMRYLLPKLEKVLSQHIGVDVFQKEIRAIFLVLFGTVILFELLGLHGIIAGFFAGFVLADSLEDNRVIKQKLLAISYGVFIPIFFVVVGMETNLKIFFNAQSTVVLTAVVVLGSAISKLASGYLGGLLVGFNNRQSVVFGVTSIPQLSTTLAATFTAYNLNLIDTELFTAFIILSIVTTLVGPSLLNASMAWLVKKSDLKKPAVG